jgi:mono/diheme cytochrome c family protein
LIGINAIRILTELSPMSQQLWEKPMTRIRSVRNGINRITIPLFAAIILAATSHAAAAQEAGDIQTGHQIAETWCSNCHIVGPEQHRGTSTGAPTFSAIAGMKTTTDPGLHAFLQTPHHRMPDLHLTREETDDLASYIISLRR